MGLLGASMNELRFSYNNLMIWDILLVLNSLGFIADGIRTLDIQRPVLHFDYAGRGLANDAYVKGAYNEDGYDFASWRLGYSYLLRTLVNLNNVL